jgi:DNA-binding LacI/PurR family transcriptional regulator
MDGVLVLSADLEPSELSVLADLRVPIVTVGVGLKPWPRVGIDDARTAEIAVDHLLGLGHRRIGYVGGNTAGDVHPASAVDRRAGFLRALHRRGIAEDPHLLLDSDWTVAGGVAAGEFLLGLDVPPTAVLAASDEMAIGVLCAARWAGRSIPADLSVVGIDNHQLAFAHDLTTVAQPVADQGTAAGERLLRAMNGAAAGDGESINLATQLVVRASTGPPPS